MAYQPLYIKWSTTYELGIPIIDEQHRSVVSMINTFYHFIQNGAGETAVRDTLKTLESYSHLHFLTEEALFSKADYPNTKRHISNHWELLERTKQIALNPEPEKDVDSVLSFLRDWWLNHILQEDAEYVSFLRDKGT